MEQKVQISQEKIDNLRIENETLKSQLEVRLKKQCKMKLENTQVQMRKGILEFCILHVISRGEVYASDMLEELTAAKIMVVEGTLYPLLTRLKNAGLVEYKWVESSSGPPRKYYTITEKGKTFKESLQKTWDELIKSTSDILKDPATKTVKTK